MAGPEAIRVPRFGPGRPRDRPAGVIGDTSHGSKAIRAWLRRRGIAHTIPERADQIRNRLRRGGRGGRPPVFDRQEAYGVVADLVARLVDASQGDGAEGREGRVVVARHRDVAGADRPASVRASSTPMAAMSAPARWRFAAGWADCGRLSRTFAAL
jgi:hypothetical protein